VTALPEQFVDLVTEDRFCAACDENLHDAAIVREARYGMTIITCPRCGHVEQVEGRPLRRTEQRWTGLVLGFAVIGLLTLWLFSNFAIAALCFNIAEEASGNLWPDINQLYEQSHPADAGGQFDDDVQVVMPTGPLQGVQVIVTEADPALRDRFGAWFAGQDRGAVFDRAGGWGAALQWSRLWPWLLIGIVPLAIGVLWSMVLLNVSRRRMVLAWPGVCMWTLLAVTTMAAVSPALQIRSPFDAAQALVLPRVLPLIGLYYLTLLLVGLIIGRSLMRAFVRLALSPRGISALAQLWLVDGLPPPRTPA